jgi:predicted choloylglycine hydrolase
MTSRSRWIPFFVCLGSFFVTTAIRADEPFRFPEAKHGKGELKYLNGLPVLSVEGTPEEIGEQVAVLVGKSSSRLLHYPKDALSFLATPLGMKLLWPIVVFQGQKLLENFPPDYRKEFEALVKHSGLDRELLVAGNTMFDLKQDLGHLFGCSAFIVEAERSKTGRPIFGRNMDYLSLGYLHQYSLVTVYRPRGKHAFAAVGYPGLVGCLSGINDAGLALTVLETTGAREGEGPVFNPEGIPFALCYRRLLENCTTVAEAEKLLRSLKRTTTNNLAVCDKNSAAVFEITPSRVVVRKPQKGAVCCTNHFCAEELKLAKPKNLFTTLDRYATLEKARTEEKKLSIEEVRGYLDAVNQGPLTLQTMIFEPVTLTLHLAIAVGNRPAPASSQKLIRLDLAPMLDHGQARK